MGITEIIDELKSLSSPEHFAKLAHFGIKDSKAIGIKIPILRQLAKRIGKSHELALQLWATEIHEARLLATMIENVKEVSEKQFDDWVHDFDSWDICDQTCNLFVRTPFVYPKIDDYSNNKAEFVKRAAFVLMCQVALHNKKATNESFYPFFDLIEREAWDERNFVRKAVNWALRQIGKRNEILRLKVIETAERIMNQETKSARWIATDALRELKNEKVIFNTNRKRT
ncbi:MAG: DNA alkylation repair protein [Paludibacter sp.]